MTAGVKPAGTVRALEGIRVLELASGVATAYCGKLLAQCGAEVIRVEPPGGDPIRLAGPFADDEPDINAGGLHRLLNPGKRSLVLDIVSKDDIQQLKPLLASSDLLLASWRTPSALPLNDSDLLHTDAPNTTFVSISEFGRDGPYAEREADSHIIEALAGMSYVGGDPDREPLSAGVEVADYFAGVLGWIAALAAIAETRIGHIHHFVDVSIHEALAMTDDHNLSVYSSNGAIRRRFYSRILPGYPSDIFACKDGHVAFVPNGPGGRDFAGNVSKLIERPELATDPLFADMDERVRRWRDFDAIVKPWFHSHTMHEIFERAGALGLGFGEVPNAHNLLMDEHLRIRNFWQPELDPDGVPTGIDLPGPVAKLSESPLEVGPMAPRLGEANPDLLRTTSPPHNTPPVAEVRTPSRLAFFEGLQVVELSAGWTSSLAARVLSELGANIVKVEYARPPASSIGPSYFTVRQASKRSIALNFSTQSGHAAMLRLIERADVFVENYLPQVKAQFGLSYTDLKERFPRLVMCSIAGYGQDGPNGHRPAMGMTMEPAAGVASVTGYPGEDPLKTGQTWVDPYAGLHGVGATIAALIHREITGRGQYIDASMQELTIPTLGPHLADYLLNGRLHDRHGNRRPGMVRGTYPCKGDDDWLAISLRNDAEWDAFCRASGNADWIKDPRFMNATSRYDHHDALDKLIGTWTQGQSKFESAALLHNAGLPAAPVLKADEVLVDPHLAARELFELVDVPGIGMTPIQRYFPPKFDGNGFPIRSRDPLFGEHTVEILVEAGIPELEAITIAREQGLVALPPESWWHPDFFEPRQREFRDYLALGSILRIDSGIPKRPPGIPAP